ncbi:MAG: type II secretion system F family protein, partial [Erysipelotrichaceae bacterium]|nr:type II secretion system F family protein [Erysipelotrichaceae bacterium]
REIYADLLKQVRTGILISDAMENTGKAFPSMLVHMIRSAEESGNMDKVCIQMADYYEKEFKLESKVKGAFAYPILLVCMLVGVIILLFTFVIPRFEELFSTLETIPLPTRILIGISDLFTQHYIGIGVFVLFMVIGIKFAMMLPTVKYYWDMLLTRLPMFGNLNKTIYTARFARTLSSLYIAGLPMSNAIGIAKNVIGNTYVESQLDKVIMSIRAGNNLSEAISTVDGFTQKLTSSIQIGEETGALDTMLVSISDMLDYESEQAITAMVGVLEPVMIIIMGAVVLFVIISVMLPMYESYSAIDMATYE